MARRLTSVGSERQINQAPGQNNSQNNPDAVTLSDGRIFVVFNDTFDPTDPFNPDVDIGGQFVNPDGTLGPIKVFGAPLGGVRATGDNELNPAVAARTTGAAAGGAVVVFVNTDAGGGDIQLVVLNAAAATVQFLNVITGTTDAADTQVNPDVATLSDGRSLIVWQRSIGLVDGDVFWRILNAAGTGFTTPDRLVLSDDGRSTFTPAVATSGLLALTAYGVDPSPAGPFDSTDIVGRLFNGATDALGAEFVIAGGSSPGDNYSNPDIAALADQRFVVVYDNGDDIFGKIFDPATPDGPFLSAQFQIDTAPGGNAGDAKVAATLDGGFIVMWEQDDNIGVGDEVHARRFDARGVAFGDDFIVNTFTDADQEDPVLAVSGVNVLTTWEDGGVRAGGDTEPRGIRGQMFTTTAFDYDSARFGDFDNDGRDDILFQNDTGDLTIWRTNSAGVLSSITDIGSLPAGFRIDGTGNFNSTAGDDILLRSPTQVAVLPMNGVTPQPMQVLGGTAAEWLNSGNGDFTGDGQSDLLFRHVNTGQIASWGVANNTLSVPPQVLGSTAPQFRIVAVDDFTGDSQADILFRDETNGEIAIWRVANNGLAGVPAVVGSTSQAYHVVATGDFDGNMSNDILFRNDAGELAMWLLNSAGELLGAPQAIGLATLDFHVEGTGDLNGDARSDIIFRNANGQVVSWFMNGTSFAQPPAVLGTINVDHAIAAHHFDVV